MSQIQKNALIEPKVLKGFRDQLPSITILRNKMIHTLDRVFSSFGFVPIDTPALEYAEILLGKGSQETDRQLYRFLDQGGRDVALRFDLTVPLARFAATHINELGTPFRRFHIAPVWRAEKPQRGRYREFIQCDFDIIGTESAIADAEIVFVIHNALNALEIRHQIRLNNRMILNGLLSSLGASDFGGSVLRAVDKLEKQGHDAVRLELKEEAKLSEKQIEQLFSFLELSRSGQENRELLKELTLFFKENELATIGVNEIALIIDTLEGSGMDKEAVRIDLTIARGLDYYTSSVFETTLLDLPHIGSICSGGRYNNLASLYTSKQLPGVGASIGLDRILGAFEELGRMPEKNSTAQILVALVETDCVAQCMKISAQLRQQGFFVELFTEQAKLGNQLKYAARKQIEYVVIAGSMELAKNCCSIKHIATGAQDNDIPISELNNHLQKLINS